MGNISDTLKTRWQTANRGMLPRMLLVAVLMLPALSVVPRAEAAPKVQPQVLAMAVWAVSPGAPVVKSATSADTIGTANELDVNWSS